MLKSDVQICDEAERQRKWNGLMWRLFGVGVCLLSSIGSILIIHYLFILAAK